MNTDLLIAQIKGIETQLAILKAHVKQMGAPTNVKTLADLEGLLAGQGDFSEEEIDAVLYDLPWEDWEGDDTAEAAE